MLRSAPPLPPRSQERPALTHSGDSAWCSHMIPSKQRSGQERDHGNRVKDSMGRASGHQSDCASPWGPMAIPRDPAQPSQAAELTNTVHTTFLPKHRNIAKFRNKLLPSVRYKPNSKLNSYSSLHLSYGCICSTCSQSITLSQKTLKRSLNMLSFRTIKKITRTRNFTVHFSTEAIHLIDDFIIQTNIVVRK